MNQDGAPGSLPEAEGGWAVETSLDVETAHTVCQNCHILLDFPDVGRTPAKGRRGIVMH